MYSVLRLKPITFIHTFTDMDLSDPKENSSQNAPIPLPDRTAPGKRSASRIPEEKVKVLEAWYQTEKHPSVETKEMLAQQNGLRVDKFRIR
jgi:hypothetical protein